MTGAPMPAGADAVVMVERTVRSGPTTVRSRRGRVAPGDHVRAAGDDMQPGDEVVPAGTVLAPGPPRRAGQRRLPEVAVRPRPRVGVLSTGDELVDGGAPLRPGQIRDSNRPMLVAAGARPRAPSRSTSAWCADDEARARPRPRARRAGAATRWSPAAA